MACKTCRADSFELKIIQIRGGAARGLSAHAGVSRRFNLCQSSCAEDAVHERLQTF